VASIELKTLDVKDPQLQQVQRNVADAVTALSDQRAPALGLLRVAASQKLVGNEDVVLVDASTAIAELFIILPPVRLMKRLLTVKVTKAGANAVTIKAVDIAGTTSPTIDDGKVSVSIAKGETGSVQIVSDGRNFSTI
jgi:hypothetical protein